MRSIRQALRHLVGRCKAAGRRVRRAVVGRRRYRQNAADFERLRETDGSAAEFPMGKKWPCLHDRFAKGGVASGQYFHQDLLVAQWIFAAQPERHVDVGSRVDGFIAHVASFRSIDVLDIRKVSSSASGINFFERNIMECDESWDDCCDSLSCLHTIEHFGLGRYGDPIDPDGWRKGWANLVRMVRPGGTIYLSTMIGPQRIEFDAHRIFEISTLRTLIAPTCDVEAVAYIDDQGDLHRAVDIASAAADRSFDCNSGCVILELRRRVQDS